MASYLGFVSDTSESHTVELSVERLSDRLSERGLTDAGWAVEAQDCSLIVLCELAHGEELDDSLLDLLKAKMISF